jgi:hypothetical protein
MSTPARSRPISRGDIEAKLGQIRDATEVRTDQARNTGLTAAVALLVVVALAAFLLGRRRGRKRRTIVEVRRV